MVGSRVIVVGSGAFGLPSAIAMAQRGHNVTLFEKGTISDPLAASTDISKVVRIEYGVDNTYMQLGEQARAGWMRLNEAWQGHGMAPLYHETGALMCSRKVMGAGEFEYESFQLLKDRGHNPQRMSQKAISDRFPAWNPSYFADGFYNPIGGYVESGKVMERLEATARGVGVRVSENARVEEVVRGSNGVSGVRVNREFVDADIVVLAAGAWNASLWDLLAKSIRPTGHPVFHFKPANPESFRPDVFPTFLADVSRTGYYGFPVNRDGVVKIGKHGIGVPTHPDGPREIAAEQFDQVREFLSLALPDLASAPIVYSRLCLYADSADSDFWVCEDPGCQGLVVAGGGSGHGYKFSPIIGDMVADAAERKNNPFLDRFRWRPEVSQDRGNEASRCHDIV